MRRQFRFCSIERRHNSGLIEGEINGTSSEMTHDLLFGTLLSVTTARRRVAVYANNTRRLVKILLISNCDHNWICKTYERVLRKTNNKTIAAVTYNLHSPQIHASLIQ
jgi:hypothetical protein